MAIARWALLLFCLCLWARPAFSQSAGASGGGGGSDRGGRGGIIETQRTRSRERFNILDWIANQKRIKAEQDSRMVKYGSLGSGLDLVLRYHVHNAALQRDGVNRGAAKWASGQILIFFNDLVSTGNREKSINVDVGFEGFLNDYSAFIPETTGTPQPSWGARETAGGLVFRPFGRSSQDTGLYLRVGYLDLQERGLWAPTETTVGLGGAYWGADFKLYLLNFLGGRVNYLTTFESDAQALNARWQLTRFKYSAFLEIFLLGLELYWIETKYTLRSLDATQSAVVDQDRGVGLAVSLFF